jgi:hypothetical protein
MFRALLAHPQEALNKRYLVYFLRVVSWLLCSTHICMICVRMHVYIVWCSTMLEAVNNF